jgi:hypothetical protein
MAIPAPFWDDDPDSWDTALLGGITLPGLARVDGLELGSKWDVKEAPGTDGATETYQGYTPSAFNLVLRIWLADQWASWLSIAKQFRPKPGKERPKPLDVVHPELAAWGIARVVIRKIKPRKLDGIYEVSFDLLEYFPQPKKTVTKTATGLGNYDNALTGTGGGSPPAGVYGPPPPPPPPPSATPIKP